MLAMMLFMAYLGVVSEAGWLLDATSRQSDFVSGPRVYFGFMFLSLRKCVYSLLFASGTLRNSLTASSVVSV